MKAACLGLTFSLAVAGAAVAGPTPAGTVQDFVGAFDRGDIAAASATNAADVNIIDEMAPHAWSGPGAFQAWLDALSADAKAKEQSGNTVALGKLVRSQEDGDTAYVVTNAAYTYTQKGVPMTEAAWMTFALRKVGGDWKIAAWTWAGEEPHATH